MTGAPWSSGGAQIIIFLESLLFWNPERGGTRGGTVSERGGPCPPGPPRSYATEAYLQNSFHSVYMKYVNIRPKPPNLFTRAYVRTGTIGLL